MFQQGKRQINAASMEGIGSWDTITKACGSGLVTTSIA